MPSLEAQLCEDFGTVVLLKDWHRAGSHLRTFKIFLVVFLSQSRQFTRFTYIHLYSFSSVHYPKAAFLLCPLRGCGCSAVLAAPWAGCGCPVPHMGWGRVCFPAPLPQNVLLCPEKAAYRKQLPLHWNEFWMISRWEFLWSATKLVVCLVFFFFS